MHAPIRYHVLKVPLLAALLAPACADGPTATEAPAFAVLAGPAASLAIHSDRDGNREIYLLDADGGSPQRLTEHPAADYYPDISANGNQVAFTSLRAGARSDLFLVSTRGGDAVNLTQTPNAAEDWARFSPNGHQLAFHGNASGNQELYLLDLRDGAVRQLTHYPGPDMWPEWAPDGHRISFRRDNDVYVLDLRGGEPVRLTHLPATLDQMAAWSPDGRQLAFMSFREGYCSVFLMNDDGSSPVNLTPRNPGDPPNTWCSRAPSWTRNGRILFMSFRPATDGDIEVFSMARDGSDLVRLTHSRGEDGGPTAR